MFHYLKWTLYGFKSTMCQTLIIKKKSSSWQIAMFDRNKILLLVINQIQEPLLHVMMPLCWLFCYNSMLDHVLFLIFCTYSVYVKCLCVFFNVALINIESLNQAYQQLGLRQSVGWSWRGCCPEGSCFSWLYSACQPHVKQLHWYPSLKKCKHT